jgi:hypothetical protein
MSPTPLEITATRNNSGDCWRGLDKCQEGLIVLVCKLEKGELKMLHGLMKDSAVVGTYKRLTHKKRNSAPVVSYKAQGDFVAGLLWKMASPLRNKLNKKK